MKKVKKYRIPIIFTMVGIAGGYFYYKNFACTTGCIITSNPYVTMAYMGLMGYLISTLFTPKKEEEK